MNPEWYIDITVKREGEKNPYGDPIGDSAEHVLTEVLFDPGTSTNEADRMELTEDAAKLYISDSSADIRNGDRVTFEVYGVKYSYSVAGNPLRYPEGCVVNLGD